MKYLYYKIAIMATFLLFFTNFLIAQKITREQYIDTYKDIAIRQMKYYGIPASIILAQACLESGDGNSRLAIKGNNHFGIKCHNTWRGKRIYHNDDERGECFRKYTNSEDSFKDHSEFLTTGKRYQSLFDLKKTDYKEWAHGLKAAGYATNPKYASLLIEIIEKNELYKYDSNMASAQVKFTDKQAEKARKRELRLQKKQERAKRRAEKRAAKEAGVAVSTLIAPSVAAAVAAPNAVPAGAIAEDVELLSPLKNSTLYRYSMDRQIYQENGVPYIIATLGDTYSSIAKEYNLFTSEVMSFNDIERDNPIEQGTIVYIKRKKKNGNENTYIVTDNESMYSISQKKGIKLQSLYDLNKMKPGTEPESGKILNLRK